MNSVLFAAVGQVSKTLLESATEIPRQENNTNSRRKIKEEADDGFFILSYVFVELRILDETYKYT